jgi:hypothetical protein
VHAADRGVPVAEGEIDGDAICRRNCPWRQ